MNTRLRMVAKTSHTPPQRNPTAPPDFHRRESVRLTPIAWGKPDSALARVVCRSLVEATPPIVIPANPLNHGRVRAWLLSHGIHH